MEDPDLKKTILTEMMELAAQNKLTSLEKPKELFLTQEVFTVENDLLTPTFKLKRNKGRDKYQAQIDQMYSDLAKRGL